MMKTTNSLIGIVSIAALGSLALACGDGGEPTTVPGGTAAGGSGTGDGTGGGATGGSGTGTGGGGTVSGTQIFSGSGSWIDMSENTIGISGAFFVLEDSMEDGMPVEDGLTHTDLSPDEFSEDTDMPCVSGEVAQVTNAEGGECDPAGDDCEWSAIWGGGIGLNLNETGGEDSVKSAYDADTNGVSGFTFTTSGDIGGADLRFKAKMEGSDADFCTSVTVGEESIALSDLQHNCFPGGMATETLDTTKLMQLEWQIVPDASESHTVTDFCIEIVGYF